MTYQCSSRFAAVILLVSLAGRMSGQGTGGGQRPAAPTPTKSVSSIAAEATPATVTIIVLGDRGDTIGQGSGFLVRPNGTIITNWHVLQGASRAIVLLASRERFDRVSFLDGDSAADLAIIKVPGIGLPVIEPRVTIPEVGDRVVAIGSPLGLSRTVTEGIVSAVRLVDGRELVQVSAPISPGSSGGAVLDGTGKVFAVSTSYLKGGQQLNFAIPVRYALGLLADSSHDRPLREVFGRPAPQLASAPRRAGSQPQPTSHLASTLAGTFYVHEEWFDSTSRLGAEYDGFLLYSAPVGFLTLGAIPPAGGRAPFTVFDVRTFRTNPAGQVVFDVVGSPYDGYQTDEGFFVSSTQVMRPVAPVLAPITSPPERFTVTITGARATFPLSDPSGLYRANVRTTYRTGNYTGGTTDWSGEAAVIVSSDSIWIDLHLTNSNGGSTGIHGAASMSPDGSFAIVSPSKTLRGAIHAGVLDASWSDERDGAGGKALYQGRLEAVRY